MLSSSLGQSWSPSPTQTSAQDLGEDDQQPQPQQEDPGSEAIVFEKKWMVTDVGDECAFPFLLRPLRFFADPDPYLVVSFCNLFPTLFFSFRIRLGYYGC